jgi:hypothetical protein
MEQEMSNFTLHLKSSLVLNGISYFQSSFVCVVFCPYVYSVIHYNDTDNNGSYLLINVELKTETAKGKLNDCHFEFELAIIV